jgi:hypothetical protein
VLSSGIDKGIPRIAYSVIRTSPVGILAERLAVEGKIGLHSYYVVSDLSHQVMTFETADGFS